MSRTRAAHSYIALIAYAALGVASAQPAPLESFRILLRGPGQSFEYSVDRTTFGPFLATACEKMVTSACATSSRPVFQSTVRSKFDDATRVRAQLDLPWPYDAISVDDTGSLALIGDTMFTGEDYEFKVVNLATRTVVRRGVTQRRIRDVEWVGTRGCFALLTSTHRISLAPWNWPLILAGHPQGYDTYYLEVYSPDGSVIRKAIVREDLRGFNASLERGAAPPDHPSPLRPRC